MTGDRGCGRCGSSKILPYVDIKDYWEPGVAGDLGVEVHEDPQAFIFKGAVKGPLVARVCGECGFVELFVKNPAELWEAFRKNS